MEAVRLIETGAHGWTSIGTGTLVAAITIAAGVVYVGRVQEVMRPSRDAYLR